jgi:hypothetical protein
VFAVGDTGTILHYNGTSWSAMSSGTVQPLYGVWGSAGNDVYAVGGGGIMLHYDGSTWSYINSGTINTLYGVWGNSANDVFAVGDTGTILHYNGTSWSAMSSGTIHTLYGVWGSTGNDVYAVGGEGDFLRYNGSTWSWGLAFGSAYIVYSVWGSSKNEVFIAGRPKEVYGNYGVISHCDGTTLQPDCEDSTTTDPLHGIWGSSCSDVFAVGAGTIWHSNSCWTLSTTTTTISTTTTILQDDDADGDGVNDENDKCPDTPADTKVNARGCPNKCPSRQVLGDKNMNLENLLDFRDNKLAQNAIGRKIISIYYNNADSINAALESSPALRDVTRSVLEVIAPIVGKN